VYAVVPAEELVLENWRVVPDGGERGMLFDEVLDVIRG
jgi:hypothetical protein|tara:strand:- start:215 stop:328 length:114 start_codon:yes stop_codon:yes gene_type:complete